MSTKMIIASIIVNILEILYYSIFYKITKKEGSMIKYVGIFILGLIPTLILTNKSFIAYFLSVFLILGVNKHLNNNHTRICDLYIILVMMFIKIVLEGIVCIPFLGIVGLPICTIIFDFLKVLFLFIAYKTNILNKIYVKTVKLWDNNNFYVRYFTTIGIIVYLIISLVSIY